MADDSLTSLANVSTAWVRTRSEAVRAQTEWNSQHELLVSAVQQLKDRADAVEAERDSIRAKGAQDRAGLARLRQANAEAREELAAIEAALRRTDEVLLQLRPQLPPRLSAALELPFRTMQTAGLGLGERMQMTIAVLSRSEQFNRTVTGGQEIVAAEGLPGAKLLDTVYWGLANGYAFDRASGQAWIGRPAPGGWRWQLSPAAAPGLRALLAAREDRAEPRLVNLPAQLAHAGEGMP